MIACLGIKAESCCSNWFMFLTSFQANDSCHFTSPLPLVLADVDSEILNVDFRISVGTSDNLHFITASTAAVVESLSLVFLAFVDGSNDSYVIGVSICVWVWVWVWV